MNRPRNALILSLSFVATSAPPNRAEGYKCGGIVYLRRPSISVIRGSGDPDVEIEIERWPREGVQLNADEPVGFNINEISFRFESEP